MQWRPIIIADTNIGHGSWDDQLEEAGLTPYHIAAYVSKFFDKQVRN